MSRDVATFYHDWQAGRQKMNEQTPDLVRSFGTFYQAIMKEGALSTREKELIALAAGLVLRCTPCVNLHVQGCLKAGATREQILEAAAVAVMMQGGPAFTHVPEVLGALDHLQSKAAG